MQVPHICVYDEWLRTRKKIEHVIDGLYNGFCFELLGWPLRHSNSVVVLVARDQPSANALEEDTPNPIVECVDFELNRVRDIENTQSWSR